MFVRSIPWWAGLKVFMIGCLIIQLTCIYNSTDEEIDAEHCTVV